MFKTWDEMSELEQLQCTYSDAHKDAYGFRPRYMKEEHCQSVEWLRAEIQRCSETIQINEKEEQLIQEQSIQAFEKRVNEVCSSGAKDRKTAIRWLIEAENNTYVKDDPDAYCYLYNLPYNYIKKEECF